MLSLQPCDARLTLPLIDSVEEHGPSIRAKEQALAVRGLVRVGAGQGSAELDLEESLGKRRAVDDDEGFLSAAALLVNRVRDGLFWGALCAHLTKWQAHAAVGVLGGSSG